MNDTAWNTVAGTVLASSEIEPYFPPTAEECDALNRHTFRARLPVDLWEGWLAEHDATRAADLKSYDALYTIWLRIARWQIENDVREAAACHIGCSIYEQVEKTMANLLTDERVAL